MILSLIFYTDNDVHFVILKIINPYIWLNTTKFFFFFFLLNTILIGMHVVMINAARTHLIKQIPRRAIDIE